MFSKSEQRALASNASAARSGREACHQARTAGVEEIGEQQLRDAETERQSR
jgi:hypothetical protein